MRPLTWDELGTTRDRIQTSLEKTDNQTDAIYGALKRGLTVDELVAASGFRRSTVSARVSEFVRHGDVAVVGTRENFDGKPVSVYRRV